MKPAHRIATMAGIVLVGCLLVLGLRGEGRAEARPAPEPTGYPYLPIITEIFPFPDEDRPAWIEFQNPLDQPVSVRDLRILINDRYPYAFPPHLPPVPPKGFVLVYLDGKGKGADQVPDGRGVFVLHSSRDFTAKMEGRPGQIAVFGKRSSGKGRLVGFVSWGAPGSEASLTKERAGIWHADWFAEMMLGTGDFDPGAIRKADHSVGLYPGSYDPSVRNWVVYTRKEMSPGAENPAPRPILFSPAKDAVVRSEDIVVGWVPHRHDRAYQFQLARDPAFRSTLACEILDVPQYRPASVLPEGTYYYRVKAIDEAWRKSAWSETMSVESAPMVPGASGWMCGPPAFDQQVLLTGGVHQYQRKDTHLLCLDGCASEQDPSRPRDWDREQKPAKFFHHGIGNCVRASVSMMASFYGKSLSQDRIAYYTQEEMPGKGDDKPEGDLAHFSGMAYGSTDGDEDTIALEWALGAKPDFQPGQPEFKTLRGWLDAKRPVMSRRVFWITLGFVGHVRVIDGYGIDAKNKRWVHIQDPLVWFGEERWERYDGFGFTARGAWAGPKSAPNARCDELGVSHDADGDGIMDFDEDVRFHTDPNDPDTDKDGVNDKNDIREYVFNAKDKYRKRTADFDQDKLRKEVDCDNDGDGLQDGEEDTNFNGKYEPQYGETSNFHVDKP